jgi:hypothetical protein
MPVDNYSSPVGCPIPDKPIDMIMGNCDNGTSLPVLRRGLNAPHVTEAIVAGKYQHKTALIQLVNV